MIIDTETLLAFLDSTRQGHWAAAGRVELAASYEELVVSPFVIAELEPVVLEQHGRGGWLRVLDELGGGAWTIAEVDLSVIRDGVAAGATLAEASVDLTAI